ncbi:MAG TPA: hypothetical protein VFE17_11910 [Candidatus Baltobacteraceae bacterium]|nr:hypothetical protein [Candidatus Baltobacteraceae bacterium]
MNPSRTVLAVLLGYLALILLEVLGGAFLYALRFIPGTSNTMIASECVVLISGVVAGGITARLAPSRPLSHAGALALAIISATSIATALVHPHTHQIYPMWYPYVLGFFGGLGAFAGGAFVTTRITPSSS